MFGSQIRTRDHRLQGSEQADASVQSDVEWLKSVTTAIRNIRGEQNISPGKPIPIIFHQGGISDRERFARFKPMLLALLRPSSLDWHDDPSEPPASAVQVINDLQILVPLAGLIDKSAELDRLDKELTKVAQEMKRLEGKLANQKFVANAPSAVVEAERDKLAKQQHRQSELQFQRDRINNL